MSVSDRTRLLRFVDEEEGDGDGDGYGDERGIGHVPVSSSTLPSSPHLEDDGKWGRRCSQIRPRFGQLKRYRIAGVAALVIVAALAAITVSFSPGGRGSPCSTIKDGYVCNQPYSHHWGQYSPFFSLASASNISPDTPPGCEITFANVLSRHGARYPTTPQSKAYATLIKKIQSGTTEYSEKYVFLRDFAYGLASENLTKFGESQMVDAGANFYQRYSKLSRGANPFIRASGSARVIASADLFIDGFHQARKSDDVDSPDGHKQPEPVLSVIISEDQGSNNTLDHGSCSRFENDNRFLEVGKDFVGTFITAILSRVQSNLRGIKDLEGEDIIRLMDLCPFVTMADSADASVMSPFCSLFAPDEWKIYDYYYSLDKYYHYGAGNDLGATQGVGYVNELVARLTNTPVNDTTTVNKTLDSNPATFPLNRTLYADFSHDNSMISIFTALGLFNSTTPLPSDRVQTPNETNGYSVSWTVPFAGRAYIEKMKCDSSPVSDVEYVRILLNDRVVPLHGCRVDALGRCKLEDFVAGLGYARSGGHWARCST